MKRFYKLVSTQKTANGYSIALDGRPVKTAMKAELTTPSENLANALVLEWSGQDDEIIPDSMPLTQILSTKIDRVSNEREAMQSFILKYLDTDLLCYRADEPPALKSAQEKAWDQYLHWFEKEYGHALETTFGIAALKQPVAAHDLVTSKINALCDDQFTALQMIIPASGSIVLGLAALAKTITADEIFAVMRVEENFKAEIYNEEFYGADPLQEAKDIAMLKDIKAAIQYLELIA